MDNWDTRSPPVTASADEHPTTKPKPVNISRWRLY